MWALTTTGVRVGEALALTWRDIDLEQGTVAIRATVATMLDGSESVVNTTKTRKPRTIPLAPFVVDLLRVHRQHEMKRRIINIRGFVFMSREGKRIGRQRFPSPFAVMQNAPD